MSIKKFLLKIQILLVIGIIYIIPLSSNFMINSGFENTTNYNIFNIVRQCIILVSFLLLIFEKEYSINLLVTGLVCLVTFVFKIFVYKEIDMGIFYVYSAYISFVTFNKINISDIISPKIFTFAFWGLVIQVIFFSIINYEYTSISRLVSSTFDSNYTAYFCLILANFFYKSDEKIKSLVLIGIGLFTYSRLFMFCTIVLLFFEYILKRNNMKYNPTLIYIFSQVFILMVGQVYIYSYEFIKPQYVFFEGFSRILNIFDESNYIRFYANKLALDSINITNFFLGVKEGMFLGLTRFNNKTIYPHNLLWSLYVQYGIPITIIFIQLYNKMARVYLKKFAPYFIVLIMYHIILGSSVFYGIDILLHLFIVKLINEKAEGSFYGKC